MDSVPNLQPTTSVPTNQTPTPTVLDGQPPSITPIPTQEPPKKSFFVKAVLVGLVIIFLGAIGYLAYTKLVVTKTFDTVPAITPQPLSKFENSLTASGITVGIPVGWTVSISTKSDNILAARFFPKQTSPETTYLEVQVGPVGDFGENNTLEFSSTNNVQKPFAYIVRKGKEKLLQSNRQVTQWEARQGNSQLLLTLFGTAEDINNISPVVEQIMQSAIPVEKTSFLIKPVYAQENTTSTDSAELATNIAGFPVQEWKQIEVMEGPYPERLTASDIKYKDGYARLYKFKVLAGQRIEILAEESKKSLQTVGSFIDSEVYNENGELVNTAQTRDQLFEGLPAQKTELYYLIVRSFGNKEGEFLLKVFDLDQVEDLYYVHYADGSEYLINHAKSYPSKRQEAVMIIHFNNPIEIVDTNKVRYFRKNGNSCIACGAATGNWFGDITIPITFTVDGVEVPVKITKMFLNQALIQPADGGPFPAGKYVHFDIDYGPSTTDTSSATPSAVVRSGYGGFFPTF